MKRMVMACAVMAGLVGMVRAGDDLVHGPIPVFSAVSLTTNATSGQIAADTYKPAGYFSLQLEVSGTGTVRYVEVQARNSSSAEWIPVYMQLANSIYTNRMFESWGTNSGTSGSGLVGFGPPVAKFYRMKIYGTNGTVVCDGHLAVQ